jgi:excisionase family DNA binding protein
MVDVLEKAESHAAPAPKSEAPAPPRALGVDLLTVSEAAQMLRVTDTTVRNWIAEDRIPYIQLPSDARARKSYRIPLQALLGSLSGTYDLRSDLESQRARMREAGLDED